MTERERSERAHSSFRDKTDSDTIVSIQLGSQESIQAPEFPAVAVSLPKHVANKRYRAEDSSTQGDNADNRETFPADYNVYG